MLPKQAISTFISNIDSRIPPPVHTAGIEDERPVPVVLVENVQIENKNHHNSALAGYEYDSSGNVVSEIFRHYYTIRLELLVRDHDETRAFDYLGQLQQVISDLGENPTAFHDHVNDVTARGSGGVSYQFYEPAETEINQTVEIETFYETTDSDVDVIDTINENYNIS